MTESWAEKFTDNNVNIADFYIHDSWEKIMKYAKKQEYFPKISKFLSLCLKKTDRQINIYPYPDNLFNALNFTPLDKVKVVILGQDPYHKNEMVYDEMIPQAMGLSFSVQRGIKTPSSLSNIYINQLKFGHIDKIPNHGDLKFWAYQGCLMLNTSLTVQHGYPNSHSKYWVDFTDDLIKYISKKLEGVVFVLWGRPALEKLSLIDTKKHYVSISSHPSGLSNRNRLGSYDCFDNTDHFGFINKCMKKNGKEEIIWRLT